MTRPIICFKHCSSKSFFCEKVPLICSLCKNPTTSFILEPFVIPCPFTNGSQNPTSIVLRPSSGDFLHSFSTSHDLHIGAVNSSGKIVEFDKRGLIRDDFANWKNCVSLKLVPDSWESHWDETLEITCNDPKWNKNNYHEKSMNCFNFIIDFLKLLKFENIQFMNKEEMCEIFILPKLQEALRYISLHRKLLITNCFVEN